MKKWLMGIFLSTLLLTGCQKADAAVESPGQSTAEEKMVQEEGTRGDLQDLEEILEQIDTGSLAEESDGMKVEVKNAGHSIVFELNDSQAARDLYEQLPLKLENQDFSNNEKTFYPDKKLDVTGAPYTDGSAGTLAYYEPWGDVVLFYGIYTPNDQLYALGKVVSGEEFISEISGEIEVSVIEP